MGIYKLGWDMQGLVPPKLINSLQILATGLLLPKIRPKTRGRFWPRGFCHHAHTMSQHKHIIHHPCERSELVASKSHLPLYIYIYEDIPIYTHIILIFIYTSFLFFVLGWGGYNYQSTARQLGMQDNCRCIVLSPQETWPIIAQGRSQH